jgi:hypothetical protein
VLPYTSGTTGLPKGCMHPHRTLMHNAVASSLWGNATSENVTLAVVPMFHITGMVSMMHATIYSGGTLVIMPRWDRELAGRLISRWKVTLDQHPHHGHRPDGQPQLCAIRPLQPQLHRWRRRGHAPGRGPAPAGQLACAMPKAMA